MTTRIDASVRQFIVDNFLYRQDDPALTETASLLEAGLIDSTGILELVCFIEKTFGIRVQDAEIVPENLDSIARIRGYVEHKLAATADKEAA